MSKAEAGKTLDGRQESSWSCSWLLRKTCRSVCTVPRAVYPSLDKRREHAVVGWLIGALAFLGASFALFRFSEGMSLGSLNTTLIGVNVSLAVFAINFSFLGYQTSQFKHLRRTIPLRMVLGSLAVILLATSPLVLLLFAVPYVPRIALGLIPLVAYSSVFLLGLAQRETNPLVLLERLCSGNRAKKFLQRFAEESDVRLASLKEIDLSKPADMPPHEWEWHIPPDLELKDPFNDLFSVARVAVKNSDLVVFERAMQIALERVDAVEAFQPRRTRSEPYKITRVVTRHVNNTISRVVAEVVENDKSGAFLSKALDILSLYMVSLASASHQTSDKAFFALSLMETLGKKCLESGQYESAIIPVVIARQLVQKGMLSPPDFGSGENAQTHSFVFKHGLSLIPDVIKDMGRVGVTVKDSNYVYRCLDALGWLGCSAIKANRIDVVRTCLRGIAQLGRESRAAELQCFWDRCALQPADHARERIEWIISWLDKVKDVEREACIRSLEEALSRLQGTKTDLAIVESDGKLKITINDSDKPYVVRYSRERVTRQVDYSDPKELKDLVLY